MILFRLKVKFYLQCLSLFNSKLSFFVLEYPDELPKLPLVVKVSAHDDSSKIEESGEETLKSGMETSVEMDNSTDVEMADS